MTTSTHALPPGPPPARRADLEDRVTRGRGRTRAALQLIPVLALLLLTFVGPMAWLLRMSLNTERDGLIEHGLSLGSYSAFLSSPFYRTEIFNTLMVGVVVTALSLVFGYPIALFLLRSSSRHKGALLALTVAPLLTSTVVRTFGWLTILGNNGVVNNVLISAHLVSAPLRLANNQLGVYIALTEILMPYMILAIFTGSSRLSTTLEEAAATLGGSGVHRFLTVTFPLTLPGVVTGCLIVFVLAISSFITPELIGGGRVFLVAPEIYNQAVGTLNWPLAAAMAFVLLAMFSGVLVAYQRLTHRMDW